MGINYRNNLSAVVIGDNLLPIIVIAQNTVISKSLRPVIRNYVFLLSILSRIQITATAGIFCS